MSLYGLIMAGGKGTRMKSKTNKLLHKILGKEIIKFPVDAMENSNIEKIILITGKHNQNILKTVLEDRVKYVLQKEPLGTADAVKSAIPLLEGFNGELLITVGDNPYLDSETIKKFHDFHKKNNFDVSIVTTDFEVPPPYGRIIRDKNGNFVKLVEEIVATEEEKLIKEVSSSIFLFNWQKIRPYLYKIKNNNPKKEYFLPDAINFLSSDGGKVGLFKISRQEITKGLNNRIELIEAIKYFNIKNIEKLIENGVTFISPENTFVEFDVKIGNDSTIYPFNYIKTGTIIKAGSTVKPFQYQ